MILAVGSLVYLYARLSLALPGIAIGAPNAIVSGWRNSRGNSGQLVAVIVLVSLPAIMPLLLLDGIWPGDVELGLEGPIMVDTQALREWPAPFMAPSGAMALWAALYTVAVLSGAAALSLAYKQLEGADAVAGDGGTP